MSSAFTSAGIVAPLMLAAAAAIVFFYTGWQDRRDAKRDRR